VRVRRGVGRLAFAAPKLRRTGPVELDILARVIEGLRLAPEAIIASNWVDNGPGWLALLLATKDEVLAIRPDYAILSGLRVGVVGAWKSRNGDQDAHFEVRAFTAAGYEDPVTGSLHAGLAQWLIDTGVAPQATSPARVRSWAGWVACMWSGTGPKFGSAERSQLASLAS
jgi:predicted PhzF superfamily epimerase YddE/YHI9